MICTGIGSYSLLILQIVIVSSAIDLSFWGRVWKEYFSILFLLLSALTIIILHEHISFKISINWRSKVILILLLQSWVPIVVRLDVRVLSWLIHVLMEIYASYSDRGVICVHLILRFQSQWWIFFMFFGDMHKILVELILEIFKSVHCFTLLVCGDCLIEVSLLLLFIKTIFTFQLVKWNRWLISTCIITCLI